MNYQELKDAALCDLAAIAIDSDAAITPRLAAFEALAARVSEIPESWSAYTESERAAIVAVFTIDAEAMAALGFISTGV